MNQNMIMVVDDEKPIRELFRDVLESRGYEVVACENGEEAIGVLKRRIVFAAFVDIRMPGMDGIQLSKEIKSIRSETNVIMITGYTRDEAVNEAMRQGCFVCMMKPFNLRDITGVLDILELDSDTRLAEQRN